MKKSFVCRMIALMFIVLSTSILMGEVPTRMWSRIHTELDGVATDLEKTDFGYAFTCGSGLISNELLNVDAPTTLVATNNYGNIIWQITNDDLIFNSNHKIVFACHKYNTNHYMFLIAGYGNYQDSIAMHFWPVIAIYNPEEKDWRVTSLPVKSHYEGSSILYPSDIIYYDNFYYTVVGHASHSSYTGIFQTPVYFDGTITTPIILVGICDITSKPVYAKIDEDSYIVAYSYNHDNSNHIGILTYDSLGWIYSSTTSAILTPPLNQYRTYDVQSIYLDNDKIILGSKVNQSNYNYANIIETNIWGYLFNSYTYSNVACRSVCSIKDNNNMYLAVGGNAYQDDSLQIGWPCGYYLKLNSDFSFQSYYEYPLNYYGIGPSNYVEVANTNDNSGQIYLGTYTTDKSNPDNYYPYLKYLQNLQPDNDITNLIQSNSEQFIKDFVIKNNQGQIDLSFRLDRESEVKIAIYDIQGREISNLLESHLSSGIHSISWNKKDSYGNTVANGCYIFRVVSPGNQAYSNKFMIIE